MKYSDIQPYFESMPLIYLANAVDDQAHVRVVSLIRYNEKLWFCSPGSRPKCEQLRKNNKIEFNLVAQNGNEFHNIRATGKALEITDPAVREDLSSAISFFQAYWTKSTDPEFVLYHLDIERIEYHLPGGKEYYIIHPKTDESQCFTKNFRKRE